MITFLEHIDDVWTHDLSSRALCVMVRSGELTMTTGESDFRMTANTLLVLRPPYVLVRCGSESGLDADIMLCDDNMLQWVVDAVSRIDNRWYEKFNFILKNKLRLLKPHHVALLGNYISTLKFYCRNERAFSSQIIKNTITSITLEMLASVDEVAVIAPDKDVQAVTAEAIFKEFVRLVRTARPRPRDVGSYADKLNVTPKHLSYVCKTVSGQGPKSFIDRAISADVEHMLLHTDLSIKEIAFRLGFADSASLTTFSRKHLGATPTDYRLTRGR